MGVWHPRWCPALVLPAPGNWGPFLNFIIFHIGKMARFSRILCQSWKVKFHLVKLLKFKTLNFDLKFCWNWSFFHYEKNMRFKKKSPQLHGAGRTWAGHHHGSHTPLLLGPFYIVKWPVNPNILAASVQPFPVIFYELKWRVAKVRSF